jgi:hypothetical protein
MAQFQWPISDITNGFAAGGWDECNDGGTPNDSDFAYSADNADVTLEVKLTDLSATEPGSGTCTVKVRHAQADGGSAPSSGGSASSFTIEIFQAAVSVAGPTSSITTSESTWATDSSLTFAASAVSDWADVRIRIVTNGGGGSPANRRGVALSWMELETPDASANHVIDGSQTPDLDPDPLVFTGAAPSAEITHIRDVGIASPSPAFTGYAPSAKINHIQEPGIASPSPAFTGYAPTAIINHIQTPDTGSVTFDGTGVTGGPINSGGNMGSGWGVGLSFVGQEFTIVNSGEGDIVITDASTGSHLFTGITPTAEITHNRDVGTDALQFTGYAPTVQIEHNRDVGKDSLVFTGYAPTASTTGQVTTITPTLGAIAFTGNAPSIVVVGSGVSITNANATTSVPSNYEQCDYTGFRQMPGSLKLTWNKYAVRRKSYESRHPQEVVRNVPERKKGSRRPEADDRFISDIGTVDAEDL